MTDVSERKNEGFLPGEIKAQRYLLARSRETKERGRKKRKRIRDLRFRRRSQVKEG